MRLAKVRSKEASDPAPEAIVGTVTRARRPKLPFGSLVSVTGTTIASGIGLLRYAWTRTVVVPPALPPLTASSRLSARKGAPPGSAISIRAEPLPTIAAAAGRFHALGGLVFELAGGADGDVAGVDGDGAVDVDRRP